MWISRVRVSGGFLAGLDVHLSPGLNVVIGPRGSGKSNLLRLIRHGLGLPPLNGEEARQEQEFLRSVLGEGEITLDLEFDGLGSRCTVDAHGNGRPDRSASMAIALGQNELEMVASSPTRRLELIDRLSDVSAVSAPSLDKVAALTGEIANLRGQIEHLRESVENKASLEQDRAMLAYEEEQLLASDSGELSQIREELRRVELDLITNQQQVGRLAEIRSSLTRALDIQREVHDTTVVATDYARTSIFNEQLVRALELASSRVEDAQRQLEAVLTMSSGHLDRVESMNRAARQAATPLREQLEAAEEGLGRITASLRNVDLGLAELKDLEDRLVSMVGHLGTSSSLRSELLESVESHERQRFEERQRVARAATTDSRSEVVVRVEHLAETEPLSSFLAESMRGTGTRQRVIEAVAASVLPMALVRMAEAGDAGVLSQTSGISRDQAVRFLDNLSEERILADLARVRLRDRVTFALRDGVSTKTTDEMSTGQKCAVTLPLVLADVNKCLLLDQPEDHLDNAYLVRTVVSNLVRRSEASAQTIVVTHNPNIPVLGSAGCVIALQSDGRRGTVSEVGRFDASDVVGRITSLMEGGRDAFARRAEFYASHGEAL